MQTEYVSMYAYIRMETRERKIHHIQPKQRDNDTIDSVCLFSVCYFVFSLTALLHL